MSAAKISRNTTNILNCFFQNEFTLWHIRLNIYKWKTKFTPYKQYFLGLLFSRNAKKTDTDQSELQAFLFCLKRNVSQIFKSSSCKKVFPKCVYHWYNLLRRMFFIPFDNWKEYFLHKFIVTLRLGATAMLLRSLKQVSSKKSAFCVRYLHNNITMMLIPKVQNKTSTS